MKDKGANFSTAEQPPCLMGDQQARTRSRSTSSGGKSVEAGTKEKASLEPAQTVIILILSTDIKEVGQQSTKVVMNAQVDGSCPRPLR